MSSVDAPAELSLAGLNELALPAARRALTPCCAAPAWVSSMAARRPYASVAALLAQSDAAVAAMTEAELRAALDGHPRIGDRHAAKSAVV